MTNHERLYAMTFAYLYPMYVDKAEKKGRTQDEVDTIIMWLFGYTPAKLKKAIEDETAFGDFVNNAPKPNPLRKKITGVVCGVRVEDIEEPTMQEIRYLDKLIDELAKGKSMEKILRTDS